MRPTTFITALASIMLLLAPFSSTPTATISTINTVAGTPAVAVSPSLHFIANTGQFDSRVHFLVHGSDRTIWLADDGIWVTLTRSTPAAPDVPKAAAVKISFLSANLPSRIEPFGRLPTSINYFIGNDPTLWRTNVPVYAGIHYRNLYPGMDLEISGASGRWTWRLICANTPCPATTLAQVRLRVEGAEPLMASGVKPAAVAPTNPTAIRLATAVGEFTLPLLTATGAEGRSPRIERLDTARFDITAPFADESAQPATATPAGASDLLFATFLGGIDDDNGTGIAVDGSGNTYVTGDTFSVDFPTTPGAYDPTFNGSNYNVFVAKLTSSGTALLYATFLGGSQWDSGEGIAVDESGNAYVAGYTQSADFPVTPRAYDKTYNSGAGGDAFLAKLNPSGTILLYATFLGGSRDDYLYDIALDGSGNVFMIGKTESADFPTTAGAYDTTYNGDYYGDAFVAKLSSSGTELLYATFLGGSGWDVGYDIALDGSGAAYVTGWTRSTDFPTTAGAYDRTYNGGGDVFVTKLNPNGTGLVYATFLGGSASDSIRGIAVDGSGHAYVTGWTTSTDFPTTAGAYDTTFNGGDYDAFVAKLNPSGTGLVYATFLGGSTIDRGYSIAVDGSGNAYVTGETSSVDFPTTSRAVSTIFNGGDYDAFVVKLNPSGRELVYATFLGGNDWDTGRAIAVDESGNGYVTGWTDSGNFPTTPGVFDMTHNGYNDAFVVKLALADTYTISGRITTPTGAPVTNVTVSNGTRSALTDANGNYTLTDVPAGSYTLTPSRDGYTFTPPTHTVTVNGNLGGMDFIAIFGFAISGRVLDDAGTPVVGVTISTGTHSTTTDSTGAFTLAGLAAGAYTLTPTKAGYAFDPPSRRVQVNGNFTGIAFRAFQPDPAKPIDLIVSFDGNPTSAQRAIYEDIFRSFADAVFEFTNGAHKVRTVQFYTNGARRTDAHIRWLARCLPQANVGSALIPGAAIVMCDTIDDSDANLLADPAVAGYILAHNWGHAYYGLYDEGPLNAPCPPNQPDRACSTDEAVIHTLMNPQAPWQARIEGPVWLNASTVLNRRTQTAQYRMHQASSWETLARPLWADLQVAGRYPPRPYHPELATVAPASGQAAPIDLVSGHTARSRLTMRWETATANLASTSATMTASVTVLNGDTASAGSPLVTAAVLRRAYPVAGATTVGVLRAANGQEWTFTLHDDGSGPDWQAHDGIYIGQVTPPVAGTYTLDVRFSNPNGAAVEVYDSGSIIVPPGKTVTIPPPQPINELLDVTAHTTVIVGNGRHWQTHVPLVVR
ncbi:SBBP repeat-containing protein [uncultured Chloroflexus sp.]|uniref:SBBP repeat-containing protein n=1 Tax=uncultured Chloroflexus sp. TaxID=214040 RepID=UPI0026144DBD|nr:SBBP repeat-containing protein [uncultured Chloroflexus sp.]